MDATKASGWKIEFHTWHTVPVQNTKCKILLLQDYLFHFLKITNESCTKLSLPKSAYTALPLGLLS